MSQHRLIDEFIAHEGRCTDKWEQYISIYESELKALCEKEGHVRLLEIGVQNGGSLELWSKFLPKNSTILGVDINPAVETLKFESDRIATLALDATDLLQVESRLGQQCYDVIIDDGSHVSSDIIKSLEIFFERLAPGGKYIIEDLHCSYFDSHEGGLNEERSSVNFLKKLIDAINYDHISIKDKLDYKFDRTSFHYNKSIARISFYDSVCVLEKLESEKKVPYKRVRSGSIDAIQPYYDWIGKLDYAEVSNTYFNKAAKSQFDKSLLMKIASYELNEVELRQVTDRQDAIINHQNEIIASLKRQLRAALDSCSDDTRP